MPLSLDNIQKARQDGYRDDEIIASIKRIEPELGGRISKAMEDGYRTEEIMQSLERILGSQNQEPQQQLQPSDLQSQQLPPSQQQQSPVFQPNVPETPAQKLTEVAGSGPQQSDSGWSFFSPETDESFNNSRFGQAFSQGLRQSTSGELANLAFGKPQEDNLEDPSFWESLVSSAGSVTGNAPYFAPGAALGSAVGAALGSVGGPAGTAAGGLAGGAFGTFAFPAFLEESLKQYREFTEKGNDLTFGEFLERADKVANKTLTEGAFGIILGAVNKASPLLKEIPGIGKLFSSKIGQKAGSIAAETAALATVPAIAQGRLPEGKDFAHSLAMVVGFNLAHSPSSILKVINGAKKANITPEEMVSKIAEKGKPDTATELEALIDDIYQETINKEKTSSDTAKDILREAVPKKITAEHQKESKGISLKVEQATTTPEKEARKTLKKQESSPEVIAEKQKEKESFEKERGQNLFSEKVGNSERESKLAKEEAVSQASELTGNRKTVAERALKQNYVRNPEQLNSLINDYNEVYPGLKGNVKDRNRKFLSQYIKKNKKQIKTTEADNVPRPELTEEQKLKLYVVDLRRARGEGDKAAIKEAKRKIDLQKRKIERAKIEEGKKNQDTEVLEKENTKVESADEITRENLSEDIDGTKVADEAKKAENVEPESKTEKNIKKLEEQLEKAEASGDQARIQVLQKNLTIQRKKVAKKKKPKDKTPQPIIETTGKGADQMIDIPKTYSERFVEGVNKAVDAIKNPGRTLSNTGHAINKNVFNFLAPLEKLEANIPESERVSYRIKAAQSSMSTVNSILENGIFSDVGNRLEHGGLKAAYGDYTWRRLTRKSKAGEHSIEDLDAYRASKQALKRQREGKVTGFDTAKAESDVARLEKKYGPIEEDIRSYNQAVNKKYGENTLGEKGIENWNKEHYTSMYRLMDSGENSMLQSESLTPKKWYHAFKGSNKKILPPSESDAYNTAMLVQNHKKNDAVLQYKKNVEKGLLPGKIKESKVQKAPKDLLDKLEIPEGEVADNVYAQTRAEAFTPSKNTLRGWEKGKAFEIEVPQEVVDVFKGLQPQSQHQISKILTAVNRNYSKGLTADIAKFIDITYRDAWIAWMNSKHGVNPLDIAKSVGEVLSGNSKLFKQFLFDGGDVYASRLSTRMERAKKIEDLVTPGREGPIYPLNQLGKVIRKYQEAQGNISMAVPFAEYKKALKTYGDTPEGRLLAMIDSRKVTYDPTRKGSNVILRELAPLVNYLNVTLQEASMLGSSLKRKEVIAKGIASMTLPALALRFWNEGNPDYDDLTPQDKYGFWHLYFGDKHFRFTTPWLNSTVFKVIPEVIYDVAMGRSEEAFQGLYRNAVDQISGQLNPLIQTAVELSTGKSPPSPLGAILGVESKAPDVIPRRLQNLPKELQYTPTTSLTSRFLLSPLLGLSPIEADRVVSNFGATLGRDGLALIDEIAYATGLAEDKRPDKKLANYLLLGKFLQTSPPSRTKYAERFYELLDLEKKAKEGVKKGIPSDQIKKLEKAHLSKYNTEISKRFKKYRDIQESDMASDRKKEALDKTQREINALYKQAVERVKK